MTSADATRRGVSGKTSAPGPAAARRWWIFLITGGLWVVFSLVVFRLDLHSVTAVGIAVGGVCIAAGINEFVHVGVSSGGWKVARVVFGVLFVLVGIVALAYPNRTFVEVAAIFSFYLAFKGMFDIFVSLAMRKELDVWWVQVLVGVAELLLGFWSAGNFGREAVLLVVWVGAASLARGVMEITLAVHLYGLRGEAQPGQPEPA